MRRGKSLVNYHNHYTLDRFDGNYAIFLKRPQETEQLLIHRNDLDKTLKEGDIVEISDNGRTYDITILSDETTDQKQRIQQLMQQLRDKNK